MCNIDLIIKVQENNRQAFRQLFSLYKREVYTTAYFILKDHQRSEDVVQETFFQVFLNIKKLSNPLAFETWLYRITINLCYGTIRKFKPSQVCSLEEYSEISPDNFLVEGETPEDIALQREFQKSLLKCVYELPVKYSTPIILFYYKNFSIKEIAAIVNSTEANVRLRLFRARKTLEKTLRTTKADAIKSPKGGALYEYR